jgi:hypothetical protein
LKIENLPSPKLGEGGRRPGEVCLRAERAEMVKKTDYLGGNFVPNEKVAPQFANANEEATY